MALSLAIVACIFAIPAFFLSVYNVIRAWYDKPEPQQMIVTPDMMRETAQNLHDLPVLEPEAPADPYGLDEDI